MTTTLLESPLAHPVIDARAGTGAGETFAFPARAAVVTWSTSFDVAPAAIDIDLEISLDGTVWTVLDTTTATAGEARVIAAFTTKFIRAIVNTNTGDVDVTVLVQPNTSAEL